MELAETEKNLIQIKTESRKTKQTLLAEQEEIKQENLSLKTDTFTLHARKENLLYDVSVLDGELEKRLDFINMLDKLKAILHKLLSMIPVAREFARLVIFPEVASWQTSKGEVVPLYEDFNRRGMDYRLVGFWNMQTEQTIKVFEIRDEIIPENRICTLEQAEMYMKAVENFMKNMKKPENVRNNRPVY